MTTSASTQPLKAYESGKVLDCAPGAYAATVADVETVSGEFGEQLRFTFKLDDEPDAEPWAWASRKLGTQTKLWRWFTALRGRPPTIGERVDPHELVGSKCQVIIGTKKTRAGDEILGVTDVLPAKRTKGGAAAKPLEPAPTTAPDLAAQCWCGAPVESYTPAGVALCAKHAAELVD